MRLPGQVAHQRKNRYAGQASTDIYAVGLKRLESVEQAVRASDATLFMVALGQGVRNATIRSGIERLVDLSGGRALFVERSDSLDQPFAEILEELANQYLIGYESSNTKRDGSWREIKVALPEQSYSVRARQGYRAPEK